MFSTMFDSYYQQFLPFVLVLVLDAIFLWLHHFINLKYFRCSLFYIQMCKMQYD